MTAIQSILRDVKHEMALEVAPAVEPVIPAHPLPDDRLWPADLAALLADNPRAVKLQVENKPYGCHNCGSAGYMVIYIWERGPYDEAPGRKGDKWMALDGLKPGWFSGKHYVSPCPRCQGDGWRDHLRDHCGLKADELEIMLGSFKAGGPFFGKEPARDTACGLLGLNTRPSGFVTFWGKPGRGKTHLLMALVNGFRGVNVYSRYTTLPDLMKEIKQHFSDDHGSIAVEALIEHYRKIRVLCIDELMNKNKNTEWDQQTIFQLIDDRYRDRGRLLTVLAMEPDPESLPDDFAYLASRISGGVAVEVGGGDMRPSQGMRALDALAGEPHDY